MHHVWHESYTVENDTKQKQTSNRWVWDPMTSQWFAMHWMPLPAPGLPFLHGSAVTRVGCSLDPTCEEQHPPLSTETSLQVPRLSDALTGIHGDLASHHIQKISQKMVPSWCHHFFSSSCEHWTQNTLSVHCLKCKNLKKCCGLTKVTIHDVGVAEQWIPELIGWPLLYEACQWSCDHWGPGQVATEARFLSTAGLKAQADTLAETWRSCMVLPPYCWTKSTFLYHFCRLRMPWDDTAIPVPDLHLIIKPMIFSHLISRCQTMMAKGEALTEYSPKRTVMDWKGWHRLVEISDIWTPTLECWTSGSPVFLKHPTSCLANQDKNE